MRSRNRDWMSPLHQDNIHMATRAEEDRRVTGPANKAREHKAETRNSGNKAHL